MHLHHSQEIISFVSTQFINDIICIYNNKRGTVQSKAANSEDVVVPPSKGECESVIMLPPAGNNKADVLPANGEDCEVAIMSSVVTNI